MAGVLVLGLALLAARADDPAPKKSEAYDALKKEFDKAQEKFQKDIDDAETAVDEAKTDAAKKAAEKKLADLNKESPTAKFAGRFLEFSEKSPKDPMAFDAALQAFFMSNDPEGKNPTHVKALTHLRTNYAAKPEIKPVVRVLEEGDDPAGEPLLREVLAKNTDRRNQAHAVKGLVALAKKDKEKEDLNKLLKDKYAEFFPDLSEGKPVPEFVLEDLNGKEVKISGLKGKVVVLDIWATWCGPCKAMIPHEREMVDRLKDKPFTLVSISIDDTKDAVANFLKKEKMPWTHCWAGMENGFVEDWDVQSIPSIYVIDAKGVIRHKGLRGEKLEDAVNDLIKEAEKK
jgi:thiol-disulfide isomerase/thioredoxin